MVELVIVFMSTWLSADVKWRWYRICHGNYLSVLKFQMRPFRLFLWFSPISPWLSALWPCFPFPSDIRHQQLLSFMFSLVSNSPLLHVSLVSNTLPTEDTTEGSSRSSPSLFWVRSTAASSISSTSLLPSIFKGVLGELVIFKDLFVLTVRIVSFFHASPVVPLRKKKKEKKRKERQEWWNKQQEWWNTEAEGNNSGIQ